MSLGAESAAAADETMVAVKTKDAVRRVLVFYVSSLSGAIPPGSLNGATVIVVDDYLPSASAASTAQVRLVRAGAFRATVLGPGTRPTAVARLVAEDEALTAQKMVLSRRTLFRVGSAALLPAARAALGRLVPLLRKYGTTAIINGYASTSGNRHQNFRLSYARAAAVASFLEERGVPATEITVVGHGAVGPSPHDQRVTVLIVQP